MAKMTPTQVTIESLVRYMCICTNEIIEFNKPKDHKKYVEAAQELADRLLSFALSAALYPCPIDEVDILSEALHVALPRSDDTSLVKFAIRREIVERWERVV